MFGRLYRVIEIYSILTFFGTPATDLKCGWVACSKSIGDGVEMLLC